MAKEYTPDHPELHLCPSCGSFFAPTAAVCPICGTLCPEEMRAGNRNTKKQKEPTAKEFWAQGRGESRVRFVDWYHSWWFIVLMFFFMPIVAIVLLITSPHKRSKKIVAGVIAALYFIFVYFGGIWMLLGLLGDSFNAPVDTKTDKETYISECMENEADEEAFYRIPDSYSGIKTALDLTVMSRIEGSAYLDEYSVYYICTAENGTLTFLVRDCTSYTDATVNFISGDVVTVYGEGAGNVSVYVDATGETVHAPCIHMAYWEMENANE